jgi:hypothetical protein
MVVSQERLALFLLGRFPDCGPEPFTGDGIEGRKPENCVNLFRRCEAEGSEAAF